MKERSKMPEDVAYQVCEQDRIVSVSATWDSFAVMNDSPQLRAENVLEREVWEFISDETTHELHQVILKAARRGVTLAFPFRCDSPACKRFMEMRVGPFGRGITQFRTKTLVVVERPAQPFLDWRAARGDHMINMCGWCKKIDVGGIWMELEDAISRTKLFEGTAELPQISHGICDTCYTEMFMRVVKEIRAS